MTPLTARLASLRRRYFSNQPNVVQTRAGVARLPLKSRHPHWIVGRDLCMFRCEDFANVPKSRRRAALALKVPVWSPFERTGWHAVWAENGLAMLWLWDAAVVVPEAAPFAVRVDLARLRVCPETAFLPRRGPGPWLQRCAQGWELQHWGADALQFSVWFPDRPDAAAITAALARHGIEAAPADAGVAATPSHAAEPWQSPRTPGEWLGAHERPLAAACLLAVALVAVWQETRHWKLARMDAAATQALAAAQAELGPVAGIRAEALRSRRRNDVLAGILNVPSQAHLMGLVDQAIPSPSTRFVEWRYQQRELTVVVEDTEQSLDTVAYVRALEALPRFEQVRVGRAQSEDRVRITLRVRA